MSDVKITLPKLGESIQSATVIQWFKKVGDSIKEDEPLLEVTTDKVNSEIPSTVSGVLKEIIADVDVEIEVGEPLALIATDAKSMKQQTSTKATSKETPQEVESPSDKNDTYLSPAVMRLAQEKGISLAQLSKIKGTGSGGRVSKKDIEKFLDTKDLSPSDVNSPHVEKLKMSGMRKAMLTTWFVHFTKPHTLR